MSNPNDYTVAWICALSTERVAAEAFLDEEHVLPTSVAPHDNNNYKLGKIGLHMVVIAVLPDGEYGTSTAACVARDLLHSFPNVRIGLMVGIGGGAPTRKHDIRLGDVVVGTTQGGKSGVLQYEFGKAIQNQPLRLTRFMNQAPTSLRAAVTGLKSQYEGNGHTIKEAIEKALAKKPRLEKKYKSPGRENDRLYRSHSIRQTDQDEGYPGSCGDGDTFLIPRSRRTDVDDDPMIHYGVIASADKLMKDATIRDRLARDHGVLCFEMEAAGLVNHFPCLVIRGICDYSDTHKNDQWQGYAAMTAAAYAKDLLLQIIPSRINNEKKITEVLTEIQGSIGCVIEQLKPVSEIIHSQHEQRILEWLTRYEYAMSHKDTFTKAETGTCQWFLDSHSFQTWLHSDKQNLLCCGNPGAGKTVLTSIVVDHLLSELRQSPDIGIAYIYCNYQRHTQQRATDLLASLLRQLAQPRSPLPRGVQELYNFHDNFRTYPTASQISRALSTVAGEYSKVFIFVDALDECNASDDTLFVVLKELFSLQQLVTANIFATARPNKEIAKLFSGSLTQDISATGADIRAYVNRQISLNRSLFIGDALKAEIGDKVIAAADGMFLLARLQTGTLLSQPTKGDLLEALKTLNKGERGLDDHYYQAMKRIKDQEPKRKALALKILTWIVHSKRRLTLRELQHALAVREDTKKLDEDFIPQPEIILSLTSGLVILEEESSIVRLVHYTAQEYFKWQHKRWFQHAESEITITCVTYLLLSPFNLKRIKGDSVSVHREGGHDSSSEQIHSLYPLWDYAVCYWGYHAQAATGHATNSLLCFLKSPAHVNTSGKVSVKFRTNPVPIMTGLHLAAYFGLRLPAACLLDDGLDADIPDSYGRTPLSYAAETGQEAIVKLLVARDDVNPNSSSTHSMNLGITPLMVATMNGHKAVIDLLLESPNIEINAWDGYEQTSLCYAVRYGNKSIAARLLENGANMEIDNCLGQTVLSVAANEGNKSMVKFLLAHGANPNPMPRNEYELYGETPLAYAATQGHEAVVELLLSERAVWVDVCDSIGQTPLTHAVEYGHEGVVKLLLEAGANPDSRDQCYNDGSPLHQAVRRAHTGIVKLLLNKVTDPDLQSFEGRTPLSYAAEKGQAEIVKLLLDTGKVDPDSKASGFYGGSRTPLSYAAERGHEDIVKLLLDTGQVNPHSRSTQILYGGQTRLSYATWVGTEVIDMLQFSTGKIDVNSTCYKGRTPLDYTEDEAVICLLREQGAKYGRDL